MDLRSTLNLPDPSFTIPMKADLPQLEPQILARWDQERIYHKIQEARRDAPAFVLHDGPPYTNSPVHIGTALNKVLKDFVVKSRSMMGFRAPYVPGYDNHGLPIEQAVARKFHEQKVQPDPVTLLKACREHAQEFIGVQTSQFQRLGVFGLWEEPYRTMDPRYEAGIIRVFQRLLEAGYVYRGLRPTLWSPTSRTALADTEIVYKDHVSRAIYVRFPLLNDPNRLLEKFHNVYTIIWTTTPWTIPSNLAVAFHPLFEYALVEVGEDIYLILNDLVPRVAEALGWAEYRVLEVLDGVNMEGMSFKHPIFDRPSIAVMAEYVTTEDGTGVVHTAPSHGRDDFYTGQKYGLPVPNTVDERGYLTQETGEFAGTFYKDCDTVVVDRLAETGNLLKAYDYEHSYPYAERDDKPVIFRATEQWFVSIDHEDLRRKMLEEIKGVSWVPATGQNRIEAMVSNRPDWCISRQRPWGVGIPIFYGAQSGEPVTDPEVIEAIAKIVEQRGSEAWVEMNFRNVMPEGYRHPKTGETEFVKETDVLDVWFDAGSSSLVVIDGHIDPEWREHWPVDVYFEGSDQHRGWFNTSLILGTALKGQAPYREVVTHGFVNDDQGRKMSKRLGNVVEPVEACNKFGADVVRLWVGSVDWPNDPPCSDAILKQVGEIYRNIRNTLRFLLSNLYDFDPAQARQPLMPLDEWIVEQTDLLCSECIEAYRRYDFNAVITAVQNFCKKELSAFYLDAVKDKMYCDGASWPERRSSQAACFAVLVRLVKLITPLVPFTCEEIWERVPGVPKGQSVHTQVFEAPSADRLEAIEGSRLQVLYGALLDVRARVFAAWEQWKGTEGIKDSQDAILHLQTSSEVVSLLRSFDSYDLANLLKMSWVELSEQDEESITFAPSTFAKCERSRLRRPDVTQVQLNGEAVFLTERDRRALAI